MATQRVSRTKNSFTRHVTWSFQTPGSISGADRKEQTPPGPMSDMFLVPIELVSFFKTFSIEQKDVCTAKFSEPMITFTLPQNNSAGIGWYSRQDIINRIIPDLRSLLFKSNTTELRMYYAHWRILI